MQRLVIDLWVGRLASRCSVDSLSTTERALAASRRSQRARARYVSGRVWVRERLAEFLGVAPMDVPLRADTRGPLAIDEDGLHLSLSHHRGMVALTATRRCRVGVDLVCVPADAPFVDDLGLVLSPAEIDLIGSAPPRRQGAVFAHCWARKEAYAKLLPGALGTGVTGVTLTPSAPEGLGPRLWSRRVGGAVVAVASAGPRPQRVVVHRPPPH